MAGKHDGTGTKHMVGELTSEEINRAVGRNFRILRLKAKMKQEFVGYRSGYAQQTIAAIERGQLALHASQLTLFAEIFGCIESDFFRGLTKAGSVNVAMLNKETKEVRDFIDSKEGIDLNVMVSSLPEHRRKLIVGLVKGIANV